MLEGCVSWPPELAARYRAEGYWAGRPLGSLLRDWAGQHQDSVALVDSDGGRLTYRELDERCDRLAAGFAAAGIAARDRVLVQLPNHSDFVVVCFALFRLGALPVFTLPSYRAHELRHLIELSGASAMVLAQEFRGYDYRPLAAQLRDEHAQQLRTLVVAGEAGDVEGMLTLAQLAEHEPRRFPEPDASDVAFFLLSGGTTALPKLIPRTHDDYAYQAEVAGDLCELETDAVYLAVLPVEFNFPWGCPGIVGVLRRGGRVVFAEGPAPELCFPLIERERVTITSVIPTIAHLWLAAAPDTSCDLSSLQVVQIGSAKLHDEVAARVEPVLGVRLQQVFGMAEGLLTFTRYDDPQQIVLTTQGRPISVADEIRVVDGADRQVPVGEIGELLCRGPYTLQGYYRAPEHNARAFTEDGFYRTGDLVRQTPTGEIVIEGRVKDVIIRGGDKISATEIEGHLTAHPGVQQAAVVPMPDPVLGEKTFAFIIASDGGDGPSLAELRRMLRQRGVADYKLPDRVESVGSLPLTGLNKVDKNALKAELVARADRRAATAASTTAAR